MNGYEREPGRPIRYRDPRTGQIISQADYDRRHRVDRWTELLWRRALAGTAAAILIAVFTPIDLRWAAAIVYAFLLSSAITRHWLRRNPPRRTSIRAEMDPTFTPPSGSMNPSATVTATPDPVAERLTAMRICADAELPYLDYDTGDVLTPEQTREKITEVEASQAAEAARRVEPELPPPLPRLPRRYDPPMGTDLTGPIVGWDGDRPLRQTDRRAAQAATRRRDAERFIDDTIPTGKIRRRDREAWITAYMDDPLQVADIIGRTPPGRQAGRPLMGPAERGRRGGHLVRIDEITGPDGNTQTVETRVRSVNGNPVVTRWLTSTGSPVCPHLVATHLPCGQCIVSAHDWQQTMRADSAALATFTSHAQALTAAGHRTPENPGTPERIKTEARLVVNDYATGKITYADAQQRIAELTAEATDQENGP